MSSDKKKISLDDIFNDDDFGLLDAREKTVYLKTEEDRIIDSFEEINAFFEKNGREPNSSSMSEYGLLARLKSFRQDEEKKKLVKPFDRYNFLGEVEMEKISIDEILKDDDFGLLDTDSDLSIFKYQNIPKEDRSETDFVAQRKPLKEKEFKPYEEMFQRVHQELRDGKRKLLPFYNLEKNLQTGKFYIIDGIMLYLESADLAPVLVGKDYRTDGRTKTIFENATYSEMLYRSLGKQIMKSGKLVTNTDDSLNEELFVNANLIQEEDIPTGWIYILKSKADNPEITSIENLYKIGFSSTPVDERIRNAVNESTYLFANVEKVRAYKCYNRNADKLEFLLHRFFANACINVDIMTPKGLRITPREWFVVPLDVIEEAINLILNEQIIHYKYNVSDSSIIPR